MVLYDEHAVKFQPSFWDPLIDTVLPRICSICRDRIPERGRDHLCGRCEDGLEWIGLRTCRRCGAAAAGSPGFRPFQCAECRGRPFAFEQAVAVGRYTGGFRDLVKLFKFGGGLYLTFTLADWMRERLDLEPWFDDPEAVACVPTDRWSRADRRYYPAEALAERVAEFVGRPIRHDLLRKARRTEPQIRLPRARRLRNPIGAFEIAAAPPKTVLLVDDVMTTGVLKRAGAERVYVAIAARSCADDLENAEVL